MIVAESVWRKTVLPPAANLKQAIARLNETGLQIILVLDERDGLLGTVTDGDIRRALLKDIALVAYVAGDLKW